MSYRMKNELQSDGEYRARYKTYNVHVMRETCPHDDYDDDGKDPASDYWTGPDNGRAFNINVSNHFETVYNGWWGDAGNTLDEAVEEALVGSELIAERQRPFRRVAA